jgi:hypothetical protein
MPIEIGEQPPTHSHHVTISSCRHGTPPAKFESATLFGSPTTVDLFSFHCDNTWRRTAFRLLKSQQIDRKRSQADAEDRDLSTSENLAASDHYVKRHDLFDSITDDLLVQILDLVDVKCAVAVLGTTCRRNRALVR